MRLLRDWILPALMLTISSVPANAVIFAPTAAVALLPGQAPKPKKPPAVTGKEITATPANKLKVKQGFAVDLLYSVPKEQQGSWVNLCVDGKGRLIVSDQYGSLYRVIPGKAADDTKVEPIPAKIGEAQGLLWAFDALYVVVNRGKDYASGLYA